MLFLQPLTLLVGLFIDTNSRHEYSWLHAAFIESFVQVRSAQTSYKKLYKMDLFCFFYDVLFYTKKQGKCKHGSPVSLAIKGHAQSVF